MPEERPDKVTTTGHLDFIQDGRGEWWGVFLACRPYEGDFYNTGRETFLLPVEWRNGYPVVLEKGRAVPTVVSKNELYPGTGYPYLTGNFTWRDEFDADRLDFEWSQIRTPRGEWWRQQGGKMFIDALPRSIYTLDNPAYLGRRQQHQVFEAATSLEFVPASSAELAGMVYFQNERFNFVFGKTIVDGKISVTLDRTEEGITKRIAVVPLPEDHWREPLRMKISVDKGKGSFFFACPQHGEGWHAVAEGVDVKNLSTRSAGGFVGATVGMFATSTSIPPLPDIVQR
jgi:alpha-N-arabinofuranosidase